MKSQSPKTSTRQPLPQHTRLKVPRKDGSIAHAPYNFVPLPNQVVPAQGVPDHDCYQGNTGWIDCQLETLTPLYVRGMMKTTTFAQYGDTDLAFADLPADAQRERARFFAVADRVIIPGSSLRGLIRALVEILAFGKVGPVIDKQIVFRAVGDPTSLGQFYRSMMLGKNKTNSPNNHFDYPSTLLKGGYLRHHNDQWYIQPAREHLGESFVHVEYSDAQRIGIQNVTHKVRQVFVKPAARTTTNRGKRGAGDLILDVAVAPPNGVALQPSSGMVKAALVVSGHMGGKHAKHWHCAIYEPDDKADLIAIPDDLWKLYEEDRDMRRGLPARKLMKDGAPLFYLLDQTGNLVFFGPTQMFRLTYKNSIIDFIPRHLRDESITDMAEAIFGYVKSNQMPYGKARACAGRVFFSDALAKPGQDKLLQREIIPQILSTPKPSTFQHYLTQPDEAARDRAKLKHYASATPGETVIRGHKLYWHCKDVKPQDYEYQGSEKDREDHKKQLTRIQPVRPNAQFTFRVYFENLTDEELGALLWALELPADCAHKLGMAKPLGLGSARISVLQLTLTDRRQRYAALLAGDAWADGANGDAGDQKAHFKGCFERHIFQAIAPEDRGDATSFAETPRIRELLTLLAYQDAPPCRDTRYMLIEPTNEYAERPVLPLPSSISSSGRAPANLPAAPPKVVSKSVAAAPKPAQELEVATLLTVPDKRQARVKLVSGAELDCSEFSPLAKNKPGSKCRVQLIVGRNGQPERAEFVEWLS